VRKRQVAITRYHKGGATRTEDLVVIEEPLEIFINGKPRYLTMRLPGEEMHLALGYCFTEGIISSMKDVHVVHYCGENAGNRVDIALGDIAGDREIPERRLPAYSGCGLCGKEMVEDIRVELNCRKKTFSLPPSAVDDMLSEIEKRQQIFGETGATHAVAVFDKDCRFLSFAEDVGRHNAIDKALGRLLAEDTVEKAMVAMVTSRLSYEMVQKVGRSNVEVLIGMSPPTSMGIDLAESINLTLIGFARNGRGNIYSGEGRIRTGGGKGFDSAGCNHGISNS
jgi:FdhD protein